MLPGLGRGRARAAQDARQRRCGGVRAGRDEDAGYLQPECSPLGSPGGKRGYPVGGRDIRRGLVLAVGAELAAGARRDASGEPHLRARR